MQANSFILHYDDLEKELQRLRDMETRLKIAIAENDRFQTSSEFHDGLKERLSKLLRTIKDGNHA